MKMLHTKNLIGLKKGTRFFSLIILLGAFTSCQVPEGIEDFTEETTAVLGEMDYEIGKERKISEDILITPDQENKVKVIF